MCAWSERGICHPPGLLSSPLELAIVGLIPWRIHLPLLTAQLLASPQAFVDEARLLLTHRLRWTGSDCEFLLLPAFVCTSFILAGQSFQLTAIRGGRPRQWFTHSDYRDSCILNAAWQAGICREPRNNTEQLQSMLQPHLWQAALVLLGQGCAKTEKPITHWRYDFMF